VFDAADTVTGCLQVLTALLPTIEVRRHAMLTAARAGFATATDLAEYLVGKGVPFRDAHEVVGQVVRRCIEREIGLDQLELDELQMFNEAIEEDVFSVLTLEGSVNARQHYGGTAPVQVRQAVARARECLKG
jgi:argininosuccinate lyase